MIKWFRRNRDWCVVLLACVIIALMVTGCAQQGWDCANAKLRVQSYESCLDRADSCYMQREDYEDYHRIKDYLEGGRCENY